MNPTSDATDFRHQARTPTGTHTGPHPHRTHRAPLCYAMLYHDHRRRRWQTTTATITVATATAELQEESKKLNNLPDTRIADARAEDKQGEPS